MEYKFYVKMDEQEFGPYSLEEIKELPLLPDTLVTESRLNGEWVTAETFDFEDLSRAISEQRLYQPAAPATPSAPSSPQSVPQATRQTAPNRPVSAPQTQIPPQNEPIILGKWNWGAFSLSWIWGVCNGVYWPLVIIACNFIPYAGPVLVLGISIYLGICGNKIAWKAAEDKGTADVLSFTERQSKWDTAGIIVFIVTIVLSLIGGYVGHKYGLTFGTDSIF